MGILDTVRETVGLIQKVDNIELYRRMLELQTQVVQLVEENRALKDRLSTKEQLVFKENSYWKDDGSQFCCRCWDVDGKLVHLMIRANALPCCPSCGMNAPPTGEVI